MMKYNWLFIASFLGLPAPLCYANTDTGEIKDAEFVIEKQKKNKVNQEQRLFFKAPTRATKTLNKPLEALKGLTLDDRSFDPAPEQYAPFCLSTKSRPRRFNHYAKAGIGTLLLPYLAVGLDNGTLWKGIWSGTLAFVPELANKKSRETALWLQSRYAIGAWLLQPDLQYQHGWHLYNGTKTDSCKLQQAKVGLLAQQAGESFTQDGKVRLQLLHDVNKKLNEQLVTLEYRWLKRFNNWALKVASYNDMASYINDDHQQTRLIFSVTPSLYWPAWQSIQLKTGLRIAYHNDPIPDKIPNFDLYPMVKIGHHAASGFRPYVGIQGMGVGGSVTPLHLYHVVAKNPFVASNVKLSHRHQYWKLYGGSQGTIATHLSYHLRLAYRQFKNQSRIMALTENQIGLAYHPAAYNVLKVTGVLEYDLPNIKLGTILKGCYYQYFDDPQAPKWWYHKPTYKFKPTLHYSPHQKLLLVSKLHLHGPTVVKDKQGVSRELGKKINLSLDMNYFISKRFTVFLLTSNLLNRKHIDYTRYPDKEINITGGLQYKW